MKQATSDFWGTILLQEEQVRHITLGDLHIWMKYRDNEIWIAHEFKKGRKGQFKDDTAPVEVEWERWANRIITNEVRIMPVFPNMPLVVNLEYTLKVSPDTSIQIYTRIPLWVRISLAPNDYQLTELPTVKLSRTWFGSPIEGELCYYATTTARRDLAKVDKKPYLVSCPILISNKSDGELNFEHFCFRVERLSMYLNGGELWSDETRLFYQGEDLNSDVIMTGKLPKGIGKSTLLSKPRKRVKKSFATRTFERFFEDILIFGR